MVPQGHVHGKTRIGRRPSLGHRRQLRSGQERTWPRSQLLRHARKHGLGTAWRMAYRRWLSTLAFEHPPQQIAFQDYVDAVTDGEQRLQRVEEQISRVPLRA